MKYLGLIWKNLFRKKLRTLFTGLSIVVAFVLFGYLAAINLAFSLGVDVTGRDRLVVIHNGIIENYLKLKRDLEAKGHEFVTETDTEIVAHAIEEELKSGVTRSHTHQPHKATPAHPPRSRCQSSQAPQSPGDRFPSRCSHCRPERHPHTGRTDTRSRSACSR